MLGSGSSFSPGRSLAASYPGTGKACVWAKPGSPINAANKAATQIHSFFMATSVDGDSSLDSLDARYSKSSQASTTNCFLARLGAGEDPATRGRLPASLNGRVCLGALYDRADRRGRRVLS